jgi:imidazolonepropionase-like amidohydrolase
MPQQILFRNFELLEPSFGELRSGYQLLVEGDTIKELSDRPIKAAEADIIDCGKRTLMPGLIDCHVHAIHSEVNVRFMEMLPLTLVTARAATRLRAMLDRGFTTVRDTGGADWGIKTAIETGHITGPRLYIAGQSIGPTGGHSDSRRRTNRFGSSNDCVCQIRDRRWRRRSPKIGARADAPGCRSCEDHDVRRRRVTLRSAR